MVGFARPDIAGVALCCKELPTQGKNNRKGKGQAGDVFTLPRFFSLSFFLSFFSPFFRCGCSWCWRGGNRVYTSVLLDRLECGVGGVLGVV